GRPVDKQRANLSLIRSWFHRCQHIHGRSCEESGSAANNLPRLRVIDIYTRNVIVAPIGCRYIALSYVWGGMKQFEARKCDFRIDKHGQEYLPLPERLTRTISDAFFVVESLGERYLWVDTLCIQQDSCEDQHDQMMRMAAIYSSAALTIVAASGCDSDVGLQGISTPRRHKQHSKLIRGFRYAVNLPSYAALEQGDRLIWNTRGWTFQEKIMSKRLLLFTDYQVYFRC
ncbi:HET-domain-containing protein, partial [Glonium stellatum]